MLAIWLCTFQTLCVHSWWRILEDFGVISGLKISPTKSEIYPIFLSKETKEILKTRVPSWFGWRNMEASGGANPTQDLLTLKTKNLSKLPIDIKGQSKDWHSLNQSCTDHLLLIKHFVFPRFLFLFQTVPVHILGKEFMLCQKTLLDFLWPYKHPRINRRLISRPAALGGLDFLLLENHYQVNHLKELFLILYCKDPPVWILVEQSFIAINK